MNTQLLTTKLYIPTPRPDSVLRSRLTQQLDRGLLGKLILVSAPAGFGKTTLVSEWVNHIDAPVAWLSLDENDSAPTQFLLYVVAALQTVILEFGDDLLSVLDAPQPPPIDSLLTSFLNELAAISHNVVLVLDDYHVLDNPDIDAALAFLLDNLPQHIHLIITTREDPQLPLARLRARGHLTEIRAADLRFRVDESAAFFRQIVGMEVSPDDIEVLDARTEGWVAGLQMAGLSMKRHDDIGGFIESFTGSHHFILDYLVEEVLSHQPDHIRQFLLRTSILDRLCGPLCDALLSGDVNGHETLTYLQRANLFLIPLDSERVWFRYHHLFGDLLRQRLHQNYEAADITTLHQRASAWFEEHELEMEAFRHAIETNDIERTRQIVESNTTPLYLRGGASAVLNWLDSLPTSEMDKHPMLWVIYGWALWVTYRSPEVEEKLQRAEAALERLSTDASPNIIGNIAAMRALLAANDYQIDRIITQSERALEFLHPDNLYVRMAVKRSLR